MAAERDEGKRHLERTHGVVEREAFAEYEFAGLHVCKCEFGWTLRPATLTSRGIGEYVCYIDEIVAAGKVRLCAHQGRKQKIGRLPRSSLYS